MAGHSKFKNIQHRKGAQDKKRARMFAKAAREITVAAQIGGADPGSNPRLRSAIQAARQMNMPRERIERAIKVATGDGEQVDYIEIRYEGYGPGGVALIVECLTDNRNRTASDLRTAFAKHGGNLGETNSVSFMFTRQGIITFPADKAAADAIFEAAVEAGAENVESDSETHSVTCAPDDLAQVRDALEAKFGESASAALAWTPTITSTPDDDSAQTLFRLIDALEDNDDVQNVSANFELADEVLERLAG